MKSFKLKLKKGYLGDFATEWWTEKDWEEHRKYVEQLNKDGKYLTEGEELTFHIKPYPEFYEEKSDEPMFKNFGMLIPNENITKTNK